MTMSRMVLIAGIFLLAGLFALAALGVHQLLAPLATFTALAILIGGGNLLYGRNSHYAKAQARTRPAQDAQNRAIDEARRQQAQAQAPEP